ncbi:HEAT repeat domain-containing protein [Candidatus Poribacteria bacterium]|nr:HEAT repeat domain-containing protein [Candidatus Poribacteria bacterium]
MAAQALINIGDAQRHLATSNDLGPLLESLDDEDDDVRYFATVALGKLGDTRALAKLKRVAQSDSAVLVREGAKTAIERIESGASRFTV